MKLTESGMMGATKLSDYFQPSRQKQALAAYNRFAAGTDWLVPYKMDLYDLATNAFDEGLSDDDCFVAFEKLYQELVSFWQVFRPHRAAQCWPSRRIFETLRNELKLWSRSKGVNLLNLREQKEHPQLIFCLKIFEGIKPNHGYPIMTVSKFLHFYNPGLFPIYDTMAIWNKGDRCRFCRRVLPKIHCARASTGPPIPSAAL